MAMIMNSAYYEAKICNQASYDEYVADPTDARAHVACRVPEGKDLMCAGCDQDFFSQSGLAAGTVLKCINIDCR